MARAWADTARRNFETQLRARPEDAERHLFLGLALGYLGSRQAAAQEGEKGRALTLHSATPRAYATHVLARTYVALGDQPRGLDELESLLKVPYYLSPG